MSETTLHRFIVIEPNHTELHFQKRAKTFQLKEMQEAVGGYIEAIPMRIVSKQAARRIIAINEMLHTESFYVFVNEDGRRMDQEPNTLASDLLGVDLLGPVLVCSSQLVE